MNTATTTPAEDLLSHTLAFCDDCLNREDYTAAWQALCRAVSMAPNRADVLIHRGRLALFLKDTESARDDFAAALKIDLRCSAAWSGLARYHLQQGEPNEAEGAADRALGIDPADEEAAQLKAEIQANQHKAKLRGPTGTNSGPTSVKPDGSVPSTDGDGAPGSADRHGTTESKLLNAQGKYALRVHRIRSQADYVKHQSRISLCVQEDREFLKKHTPEGRNAFSIPGYSYTAGKEVDFLVDYQHSTDGARVNWRERVCDPETNFNNRMRATFHLFDTEMDPYPDSEIYITEQVTPIFKYFKTKYPEAIGSEFLGDRYPFGSINENGVRNETLTALSFPDKSFDILIALDVFEHMPDYKSAFRECARTLRPGGKMMWSVPFMPGSADNVVRARFKNGEIVHILPPEYHGDPLSSEGVLCFQYFGWEMLDQMRSAGFRDAYALCYHSSAFGYLGDDQFLFVAIKATALSSESSLR